jgi:hypothetical protein
MLISLSELRGDELLGAEHLGVPAPVVPLLPQLVALLLDLSERQLEARQMKVTKFLRPRAGGCADLRLVTPERAAFGPPSFLSSGGTRWPGPSFGRKRAQSCPPALARWFYPACGPLPRGVFSFLLRSHSSAHARVNLPTAGRLKASVSRF